MNNDTNSLTDRLEVDLLRSMIVIVTVVFWSLSFLTDENPYLSEEIALWIYFIAVSPVVFLFTLSVKPFPKFTMGALLCFCYWLVLFIVFTIILSMITPLLTNLSYLLHRLVLCCIFSIMQPEHWARTMLFLIILMQIICLTLQTHVN